MEIFNTKALTASMQKKEWSYQRLSMATMQIDSERFVSLDTCKQVLKGKRKNPTINTVSLLCAALSVRVAECFTETWD
jgi:hypothetical protein